jgi:hypothetical protein
VLPPDAHDVKSVAIFLVFEEQPIMKISMYPASVYFVEMASILIDVSGQCTATRDFGIMGIIVLLQLNSLCDSGAVTLNCFVAKKSLADYGDGVACADVQDVFLFAFPK